MQTHEPALGWTLVLRCQPLRIVDRRIVDRRPEGGYNDDYELACARSDRLAGRRHGCGQDGHGDRQARLRPPSRRWRQPGVHLARDPVIRS